MSFRPKSRIDEDWLGASLMMGKVDFRLDFIRSGGDTVFLKIPQLLARDLRERPGTLLPSYWGWMVFGDRESYRIHHHAAFHESEQALSQWSPLGRKETACL